MDLVVTPGPGVPHGLIVPGNAIIERFSRSSGPGGQGVNTADSRVEIEVGLDILDALLTPAQRHRLRARLGTALVADRLVASAQENRQQRRNRIAARERLAEQIRTGLAPPPPARRATKPTKGSQERRLSAKRQRAETKSSRVRPDREH